MSSAANAPSLQVLKRRAMSLGVVKVFDHALQFLLPVVLVRCLDPAAFGEYRLLWLVVGTVMTVATLNMGASLFYFVPRSAPARKRLYVHQSMLYFALAGVAFGCLASPWNPLLPGPLAPLEQHGWVVPAFVALWVFSFLLDQLPSVDERISWQAYATLGVSALRVALVASGAWLTGDLRVVVWLLLALAAAKSGLLVYYVARGHGLGRPWLERAAFSEQFRHAAPIGVANSLNGLRGKADQWVAASLFAVSSFAAFSIAALVSQLMLIVRQSVMQVFLPSMSRLQAKGDVRGMLGMNSRGNVMVARVLYPLLGLVFVCADDMVTLVYTAAYVEAVPAVRAYVIGMLPMAIETTSLVLLLRRGKFILRVTCFTLALSVALSWSAALQFGLAGAAAGSVLAVYVDRVILLRHFSRHTGIALADLQDWRSLVGAAGFAAATAALAWFVLERFAADGGPLLRLAAGSTVFALAYAAAFLRPGSIIRRGKDAT